MVNRKISGPITAMAYSSVRLATLIVPPDATEEPSGGFRATHAVPIEGADLTPIMAEVAASVGRKIYDPATGQTTVIPGIIPPLEKVAQSVCDAHRERLEGAGFVFTDDVVGPDVDPVGELGLSLHVYENMIAGLRRLGALSETQLEGLGLICKACFVHGRMNLAEEEQRLIRAKQSGKKSAGNGTAAAHKRKTKADLLCAEAVLAAKAEWADGTHREKPARATADGMAQHLRREHRFSELGQRRLADALRPIAPKNFA